MATLDNDFAVIKRERRKKIKSVWSCELSHLVTLMAPTIIMIDIKMVMHKLNTMITLTMPGGSQSNRMVFGWKRSTNKQTMNTIDSRIAPTPATTEPVRNDCRPRQLLNIGLAILFSTFSSLAIDVNQVLCVSTGRKIRSKRQIRKWWAHLFSSQNGCFFFCSKNWCGAIKSFYSKSVEMTHPTFVGKIW